MDDNVYMEPSSSAHSFDKTTSHASLTPSNVLEFCNGNKEPKRWHPTYILDYSDLSIGESLICLIIGISFCFSYFILLMGLLYANFLMLILPIRPTFFFLSWCGNLLWLDVKLLTLGQRMLKSFSKLTPKLARTGFVELVK